MSNAGKRIGKELNECTSDPPTGCKVNLKHDDNLHEWDVYLEAPSNSVYAGGHFHLTLSLPKDYPFKPPVLSFVTKIWHPNVTNDGKGSMCLGMLRPDAWKPPNKIKAVLEMVRLLLVEPNVEDPVEAQVADQYKRDKAAFDRQVKEWVRKYAQK